MKSKPSNRATGGGKSNTSSQARCFIKNALAETCNWTAPRFRVTGRRDDMVVVRGIERDIERHIGVTARVQVLAADSLPRSEGKTKHVIRED